MYPQTLPSTLEDLQYFVLELCWLTLARQGPHGLSWCNYCRSFQLSATITIFEIEKKVRICCWHSKKLILTKNRQCDQNFSALGSKTTQFFLHSLSLCFVISNSRLGTSVRRSTFTHVCKNLIMQANTDLVHQNAEEEETQWKKLLEVSLQCVTFLLTPQNNRRIWRNWLSRTFMTVY